MRDHDRNIIWNSMIYKQLNIALCDLQWGFGWLTAASFFCIAFTVLFEDPMKDSWLQQRPLRGFWHQSNKSLRFAWLLKCNANKSLYLWSERRDKEDLWQVRDTRPIMPIKLSAHNSVWKLGFIKDSRVSKSKCSKWWCLGNSLHKARLYSWAPLTVALFAFKSA